MKVIGIASGRGNRAYMLESLPPPPAVAASLTGVARCAAAMTATVFIDAATFFPLWLDAEVLSPGRCSTSGTFILDDLGSKEQVHFTKVARKDPCGETREIWVIDEAIQYDRISRDGYIALPGQYAQRTWPLGANCRGGEFEGITRNSNFQVFVTGACLKFGEVVESKPVESLHSEIHFDLDQIPFRGVTTPLPRQ